MVVAEVEKMMLPEGEAEVSLAKDQTEQEIFNLAALQDMLSLRQELLICWRSSRVVL